jgi:hypothetical protein
MLQEDGTAMWVIDDAFKPFLLPGARAPDCGQPGIDLFTYSAF